ncbi:MAG: FMN-dependent NADH-azoreductase [Gammaproteobacteria bacterium]|nr:FMN-dependent NADH-azoreductase [Gammaproteobacteria bacterium]MYG11779.1 FMN-dependent NADH-azoreductase [Gammaproteobacteria bacterium]MYK27627.1 FMN-dependent NADH-azoreductase [Gammaproteobacteria bacterium]
MSALLYIECSPRRADSFSSQAAAIYLDALPQGVTVEHLDLFTADLPEFDASAAAAKYKVMGGKPLNPDEESAWSAVVALVEQFKAADHYLIAAPMWNFGIPYKLKQYIDLITHPGLTFNPRPDGMEGLAGGDAVVIYSRGGNYGPKDGLTDPYDHQSPYLQSWLGLVGVSPVEEVAVQGTMRPPVGAENHLDPVRDHLEALAQRTGSDVRP